MTGPSEETAFICPVNRAELFIVYEVLARIASPRPTMAASVNLSHIVVVVLLTILAKTLAGLASRSIVLEATTFTVLLVTIENSVTSLTTVSNRERIKALSSDISHFSTYT